MKGEQADDNDNKWSCLRPGKAGDSSYLSVAKEDELGFWSNDYKVKQIVWKERIVETILLSSQQKVSEKRKSLNSFESEHSLKHDKERKAVKSYATWNSMLCKRITKMIKGVATRFSWTKLVPAAHFPNCACRKFRSSLMVFCFLEIKRAFLMKNQENIKASGESYAPSPFCFVRAFIRVKRYNGRCTF